MDNGIIGGIKEILLELRIINEETNTAGMTLLGPGGVMDSLTAMRFINRAEQRFKTDIMGDLGLNCMKTTDSLAEYINQTAVKR